SGMVDAGLLQAQYFPPVEWAVEGLVPEGAGILAGPPKVGKSWLVLHFALACASGGLALGAIPCKKRSVLYCALEDSHRRLQARIGHLLDGAEFPADLHLVTEQKKSLILPTIQAFLDRHPGQQVLVILDTLAVARPERRSGATQYEDDYDYMRELKKLASSSPGSTILGVHHTRKMEAKDFMDAVSGTQGMNGGVDFSVVLKRERKKKEGVLSVTGRDVADENEFALLCEDMRWVLDGLTLSEAADVQEQRQEELLEAKKASHLGDKTRQALEFVLGREQTTPKELAEHLAVDGKLAGQYLARLHAQNLITKVSRGVYGPVSGDTKESEEIEEIPGQCLNLISSPAEEVGAVEETVSSPNFAEGNEKPSLTSTDTADSSLSSVSSPAYHASSEGDRTEVAESFVALKAELLAERPAKPGPTVDTDAVEKAGILCRVLGHGVLTLQQEQSRYKAWRRTGNVTRTPRPAPFGHNCERDPYSAEWI
ncbi:MAG: helicase RepA family protein, partial [Nocardiaceae bacterium]|nr:helicase RepA family protein [Nocardiaceae bacterium]